MLEDRIMDVRKEPLVSVVTPFYNTAKYLPECIESVIKQTYSNWEYVLVNNCSNDGSAEIAERYVASDPGRIRLVHNSRFVSQVQNYNHALQQISPSSSYCKIVQADDVIFSQCLEKMVQLARSDTGIGVVTSYFLRGDRVTGGPIPYTTEVMPGSEVVRSYFAKGLAVMGSPTTNLFRADLVRSQTEFYDERHLHEDVDVLFRLFKNWKLGFVHQVLSFERTENESITSAIARFGSFQLDQILRVFLYADQFLEARDAGTLKKAAEKAYLQFLARQLLRRHGKDFWDFHRRGLDTIEYRIPRVKFCFILLNELANIVGNPKQTLGNVTRTLAARFRRR
jgi:glycosyltransferase involved in cell wall biosynthesis